MHCCACLQPLRRQVDKIGEGHLPAAAAPAQLVAIAGQLGVANGQASQVIEDCEEHLQGESEHPVLIGQHPAGSEHQEQAGCSSCVMLGDAEEMLGGATGERCWEMQHHCTVHSKVFGILPFKKNGGKCEKFTLSAILA